MPKFQVVRNVPTAVEIEFTLTEAQENRILHNIAAYYVTNLCYFMEDFQILYKSFDPELGDRGAYYLVISIFKNKGTYILDPEQAKTIEEFEAADPAVTSDLYKYLKGLVCKGLKLAMDELSMAMNKRIATLNSN